VSWDTLLSYTFKAILLPPGVNLLLILIALIIYRSYRRSAIGMLSFSSVSLLLLSLPSISDKLIQSIESEQVISTTQIKKLAVDTVPERAIVVLSGGRVSVAPEYGQIDTVNAATLQRIQYASWLQKRTNLPVLLSGGSVFDEATAEAVLMNQVMMSSFAIAPKWIESKSKNTAENALFSAQILKQNEIDEILLVTHAWHMARAKAAFEQQDIRVIPAPTAFQANRTRHMSWTRYLPSATALEQSSRALNEMLGSFWYQLRY